jgi:cytochrome b subunit of formate dehydrogenase
VANCASCHGFHDILPASDPLSSVNKANLPQTCGKCHPGIGTRLAAGPIRIHAPPGAAEGKPWLVNFITRFYIVLIVVVIGAMLVHNALDYWAKTRRHVRAVRSAEGGELRMTSLARVQHFALIVLFALLAYTGFVHKFPDAVWSWPFRVMPNGNYIRGMIHRVCGWTFLAFFAAHCVGVFGTRNGRVYLRELWLRLKDLKDLWATVMFNLGLRRQPPAHSRFNYVEKAEYWALIWGSVVMIITGVMLIFTETVLRLLPKVWNDVAQVIHFYEALLATLAIVVWHFYWVVFDPKEYPMNPAWLIGKKAPPKPEAEPIPGIELPIPRPAQQDSPPSHTGG